MCGDYLGLAIVVRVILHAVEDNIIYIGGYRSWFFGGRMQDQLKFYIDGSWVDPVSNQTQNIINPANEKIIGRISLGSALDVDVAVVAARKASLHFSQSSQEFRVSLIERLIKEYEKRYSDMAFAISQEMGAPLLFAHTFHSIMGFVHLKEALRLLKKYRFVEQKEKTLVVKEPVGVCGMITPWNWSANSIACKIAPALAVGCTMVLKPSSLAPLSAHIWAEIIHDAGVPPGVFNLVNGRGAVVGSAISKHTDVDMVSITGSTPTGIKVALDAAPTVKRVHQELGGKAPCIILKDFDLKTAVNTGIQNIMGNTGQSCNSPSRMLVPFEVMSEAVMYARAATEAVAESKDSNGSWVLGPVVSKFHWERIQGLIAIGVEEGATLVSGGLGRPFMQDRGYYVKPTVFADVTNDMTIAREEIFGPVLVIIGYHCIEEAIEIANDTEYGLAAYIFGNDAVLAREIALKLKVGQVIINNEGNDVNAPFGGFRKSGNGRERGEYAFNEFLEVKSVLGSIGSI